MMNEKAIEFLRAIPKSARRVQMEAVIADLKATGKTGWTRSEVMAAITRRGLRPWKTLNELTSVGGDLRYDGDCRERGTYRLNP